MAGANFGNDTLNEFVFSLLILLILCIFWPFYLANGQVVMTNTVCTEKNMDKLIKMQAEFLTGSTEDCIIQVSKNSTSS